MKMQKKIFVLLFIFFEITFIFAKGKKDNPNPFVSAKGSSISYADGIVKFVLNQNRGTFQLYANGKKAISVFSNLDGNESTYFSLLVGKKQYKLLDGKGISHHVSFSPHALFSSYLIKNVANVDIYFLIEKTNEAKPADILAVSVRIENTGLEKNTFALKSVFDTVLGEMTNVHFSSAQNQKINSEMQFRTMQNEKWILSQTEKTALRFLLSGRYISPVESVTLSNKDALVSPVWFPYATEGKSFDTVVSYNNSALAITWPEVNLNPGEATDILFYLALTADGEFHENSYYDDFVLNHKTEIEKPFSDDDVVVGNHVETELENVPNHEKTKMPVETTLNGNDSVLELDEPKVSPKIETPNENVDAPIEVQDYQLDPAYIRALIEKINALDENDDSVSDDELRILQRELDAIQNKLETR